MKNKAAQALGRLSGKVWTPAKIAASKINGKKAGEKREYYVLSGESTVGTWAGPVTATARKIAQIVKQEASGGDRWASAWEVVPATETMRAHLRETKTGEIREMP